MNALNMQESDLHSQLRWCLGEGVGFPGEVGFPEAGLERETEEKLP